MFQQAITPRRVGIKIRKKPQDNEIKPTSTIQSKHINFDCFLYTQFFELEGM